MERKKKGGKLKYVFIAVVVLIFIAAIASNGNQNPSITDNTKQAETNSANQSTETSISKTDNTEATTAVTEETAQTSGPYKAELAAGHYTAGIDFPSGKYTLAAKSGSGNVSTSNIFTGGLNEVMSSPKSDYSIDVFNNAKLDDGVILSVGGSLILAINSDKANVSTIQPRNNTLTETIKLSSGNYVAGVDFPAGIYNIVAKEGSGNVNSSNMYEGGLNEVMGTESNGFNISEFKNASLNQGVELSISGVSVQLVPSK